MVRRKSSPLSLRLDEDDLAKLEARATALEMSAGTLVRSIVRDSLHSQVEAQLEGILAEIASVQHQTALLRADLNQVNANVRDALAALLCVQTGDEQRARDMADEVVPDLEIED